MQAAGSSFQKTSPHKRIPNRSKPWFDTECKQIKSNYINLVKLQSPVQIIKSARKEFRTLVRYKRRNYKEAQGNRLCSLATRDAAKFWKAFKTKPMSLKITDRATWFTHFRDLLQAPTLPDQENQQVPQAAAAATAAATTEITLDSLRRDFRLVTLKYVAQDLNVDIQESEVLYAIKHLKRNKAAGIDDMQADLVIEGKAMLAEPLTALFNKIFHSHYPTAWTVGLITPIFKKGDPMCCNNYRGITVGTTLAKVYATILNHRLSEWTEKYRCRAQAQAGFRKDHRCSDNVFILRTLIEKCKSKGAKLYCCFVDFSKAFDTVPRSQLWQRLEALCIHGNMLTAIQSIYKLVQACVKTPGGYTDTFTSEMGVLQGCILSPLLFGLFLDPLEEVLLDSNTKPPLLFDKHLPAQFFADDSQLLSTTPEGLQSAIDAMQTFCTANGLTVNVGKTKIMVFGGGSKFEWKYNDEPIEIVKSYKNLGMNVSSSGNFSLGCASHLTVPAKKSQHGLLSKCSQLHVSAPPTMLKLFDTLVQPILSYGCEVWGVDFGIQVHRYLEPPSTPRPADRHEALHKNFIKRVMEVSPSTPDAIIYGETGRLPLAFHRLKLIVKYWNRLCTLPDQRLLKKAFLESISLASTNKLSWTTSFRALLEPLGWTWNGPVVIDLKLLAEVRDRYTASHHEIISRSPENIKLSKYSMLKTEKYCMQPYLASIKDREVRKSMAKFRVGSHWLEIQQGRFTRTERTLRTCKKCSSGSVEDENHMLFHCPAYQHVRVKYAELLNSASDLSSLFRKSPNIVGRLIHECYMVHKELAL